MIDILHLIFYWAVAASLIAFVFLLKNFVRFAKKTGLRCGANTNGLSAEFPFISAIFFVVPTAIVGVTAGLITTSVRGEVLGFLGGLSGHYTVCVDRQPAAEADKIIVALKRVAPYSAHHSHPAKRIRVDIRNGNQDLTLELGRDSQNPQEYWIFHPKYRVTSNNEIGRVTTSVFDGY
jgi:hypothetical protein